MKRMLAVILIVPLVVMGCGLVGIKSSADAATRVMAGLECVQAVNQAGSPVATDPTLNFSTATDVVNAIGKITNALLAIAAVKACQDTLNLAAIDAQGAVDMLKSQATSTETPPQRKARLAKAPMPKAQAGPVVVQVPLR